MVTINSESNNIAEASTGMNTKELNRKSDKKKKHKKEKKIRSSKRKHSQVEEKEEQQQQLHHKTENVIKECKKKKVKVVVVEEGDDDDKNKTCDSDNKLTKKEKKRIKKQMKKEKKEKQHFNHVLAIEKESSTNNGIHQLKGKNLFRPHDITATPNQDDIEVVGGRIVSFSASVINETDADKIIIKREHTNIEDQIIQEDESIDKSGVTLLLFYQYIEPMLDESRFQDLFNHVETTLESNKITGRARVANEGLNCTLTGSYDSIRLWCKSLRSFANGSYFSDTEFKLTDNLPIGQAFKKAHAFRVEEIVNYGLAGERAPKVTMTGEHLEPKDYHKKMTEDDAVIIDVRNHYEAAIGKFMPPSTGAKYIDPMMRKSTEFPVWLDKKETKEMLRGKQVLMYCTGGVRCERASALLRTKIETEEDTKALGIKGVYQLQGGIDKYFRDFPEGGWWKGKNYVFDKRFAHAPPVAENLERKRKITADGTLENIKEENNEILGKCECCHKPWDRYRGKRRCPTCGVPLLICKDCDSKVNKNDKSVRCDLCVEEGIKSKRELRGKEEKDMAEYEKKLREQYGFKPTQKKKITEARSSTKPNIKLKIAPNPESITRLFVKNLNVKDVDQPQLCELIDGITHIEWIMDRKTQRWYGSCFVEVSTPENASKAVGSLHGQKVYGRVLHCAYSKPDPKSIWPPPNTKII